jgi:AraC family transcriptional regulator
MWMETEKDDSIEVYRARIRKVQAHLEANLDAMPTLEDLARIAGFSAFHFHRIFRAFVGEPVAVHYKRIRLERAAKHLTTSRRSVLEIALGGSANNGVRPRILTF